MYTRSRTGYDFIHELDFTNGMSGLGSQQQVPASTVQSTVSAPKQSSGPFTKATVIDASGAIVVGGEAQSGGASTIKQVSTSPGVTKIGGEAIAIDKTIKQETSTSSTGTFDPASLPFTNLSDTALTAADSEQSFAEEGYDTTLIDETEKSGSSAYVPFTDESREDGSTAFYKKSWFWLLLLVVGGAGYYFYQKNR